MYQVLSRKHIQPFILCCVAGLTVPLHAGRTVEAAAAVSPGGVAPGSAATKTFQGLHLPDDASLLFSVQAEGDQVYVSQPKPADSATFNAGGFEWVLQAPDARLFDNAHQPIGKHYAGPTWEGQDGSQVVGIQPPRQRVAAPAPGNIPWLLLEAKSHAGTGDFSRVDYILRVATVGGVAPAQPPTRERQTARVKYQATYLFLTAALAK